MVKVAALVTLVGCTSPMVEQHTSAVINGTAADEPAAIGAQYFEGVFEGEQVALVACSASLIAPDVMLTAAHCVDPHIVDMVGFPEISFDRDTTLPTTTWRAVHSVVLHEGYVSQVEFHIFLETPNDIALIFLAEPVTDVAPIRIATAAPAVGAAIDIAGYGQRVIGDNTTVGIRHVASVEVTEIGDSEIRTHGLGDPLPCGAAGDSGGAALADGEVVGVSSHFGGEVAACESGGVYERTDFYADWIVDNAPQVCATSDLAACPSDEGGCSTGRGAGLWTMLALGWLIRRRR